MPWKISSPAWSATASWRRFSNAIASTMLHPVLITWPAPECNNSYLHSKSFARAWGTRTGARRERPLQTTSLTTESQSPSPLDYIDRRIISWICIAGDVRNYVPQELPPGSISRQGVAPASQLCIDRVRTSSLPIIPPTTFRQSTFGYSTLCLSTFRQATFRQSTFFQWLVTLTPLKLSAQQNSVGDNRCAPRS